jgi:hypothetical protein
MAEAKAMLANAPQEAHQFEVALSVISKVNSLGMNGGFNVSELETKVKNGLKELLQGIAVGLVTELSETYNRVRALEEELGRICGYCSDHSGLYLLSTGERVLPTGVADKPQLAAALPQGMCNTCVDEIALGYAPEGMDYINVFRRY